MIFLVLLQIAILESNTNLTQVSEELENITLLFELK